MNEQLSHLKVSIMGIKKIQGDIENSSENSSNFQGQHHEEQKRLHKIFVDLVVDRELIYPTAELCLLPEAYNQASGPKEWQDLWETQEVAYVHRIVQHSTYRGFISIDIINRSIDHPIQTLLVSYGLALAMRYMHLASVDANK